MDKRPLRMLSGAEIVDRGRNVTGCILPEAGMKEVTPNGSWLEAKQIQTALEARKALVATERIDKIGALSHAEWSDQLKLAEVTQQVGGYWQYMGHYVNGTLFLLPEEALYLIETNRLLLKHNQVTVSLQKAYSLLLDDQTSLTQYKVYASLSRVGYKVFRHDVLKHCSKIKMPSNNLLEEQIIDKMDTSGSEKGILAMDAPSTESIRHCKTMLDPQLSGNILSLKKLPNPLDSSDITMNEQAKITSDKDKEPTNTPQEVNSNENAFKTKENGTTHKSEYILADPRVIPSIDEHGIIRLTTEVPGDINDVEMENTQSSTTSVQHTTEIDAAKSTESKRPKPVLNSYQVMQQKIKNRKIPPHNPKTNLDRFKDIPDCYNKHIVTVAVPSEDYLPRNVFLNNTIYVLNLKELRSNNRSKSTPPTVENRAMYRTIRNSSESETAAVPTLEMPQFLPNTPMYQQPFGYFPPWRPRFQPFNQRPYFPRQPFNQHPFFYRVMHHMPHTFTTNRPRVYNPHRNNPYPRYQQHHHQNQNTVKSFHLQSIRNCANRLKQFTKPPKNSLNSLLALLARYNEIYKERIRISPEYNIIDANQDFETIELDDDETTNPKLNSEKFEKYLTSVKTLAARLKNLERKNQSVSKQKRAFSNLLKNFNETFNADYHLNSKGVLVDKKLVVLDTSSDSDVVATDDIEPSKEKKRRSTDVSDATKNKKRKLLNPFNILKKVNEGASTSQSTEDGLPNVTIPVNNQDLSKYFNKNWLPDENDFGKATPCSKTDASHLWSDSKELYDFISWVDLNTWVDLKLSFCLHMEAISDFEENLTAHRNLTKEESRLKPILVQEPGDDWATSLEKLRIIKTNMDVQDTYLRIDFDVYNRDVQNFRKTDPPKPHFRVVCLEESSKFPSGAEVRSFHSRHDDNVTTVFAVVGTGSIVYLQINPKDLPVRVGND